LQPRPGVVADRQHRLPHPLLLVRLLVHAAQPERLGVESQGRVEVGDRHADVVDAQEFDAGGCDIVAADGAG